MTGILVQHVHGERVTQMGDLHIVTESWRAGGDNDVAYKLAIAKIDNRIQLLQVQKIPRDLPLQLSTMQ